MVHWNTFVPVPNPVTFDKGLVGVLIVPAPEINDHVPVPTAGVFPANATVG